MRTLVGKAPFSMGFLSQDWSPGLCAMATSGSGSCQGRGNQQGPRESVQENQVQSRIRDKFESEFRNLPMCLQTSLAPFLVLHRNHPGSLRFHQHLKQLHIWAFAPAILLPETLFSQIRTSVLTHISPQRDVSEHSMENKLLSLSTPCLTSQHYLPKINFYDT